MMQSEYAVDFDQTLAEKLADHPDMLDVADDNASEVLLRIGWAMALEQLLKWSATEAAGAQVHASWVHGMQRQFRDVPRQRTRWQTLDQQDRDLDAAIGREVITAAIRALGGANV